MKKEEQEDLCSFHRDDPDSKPEYKGAPIKCSWCRICQEREQKKEETPLNQVKIYDKV